MKPTLYEANVCEKQSRDRNCDEVRTQGNNDSFTNTASEVTIRKGFNAFKFVVEQLSHKISIEVRLNMPLGQGEDQCSINAPQSALEVSIPTHLVGILEGETVLPGALQLA